MPCTQHPGQPHIPSQPGQVIATPSIGWNAGARSVNVRSGPCYFEFEAVGSGVIAGIAAYPPESVVSISAIEHAFYVLTFNGATVVFVLSRGETLDGPFDATAESVFRIERTPRGVRYLIDDELVHLQERALRGAACAVAMLYTSGDEVV